MLEIIIAGLTSFITTLTLFYLAYVYAKKYIEDTEERLIAEAKDWIQSEEFAKLLYQVGGLIGNGASSGLGIQTKSGKFKWQDLGLQLLGRYLKVPVGGEGEGVSELPRDNTGKFKSKY